MKLNQTQAFIQEGTRGPLPECDVETYAIYLETGYQHRFASAAQGFVGKNLEAQREKESNGFKKKNSWPT